MSSHEIDVCKGEWVIGGRILHGVPCPFHGAEAERKPTCQYCLADPRFTPITTNQKRCPVCGAAYSGPRRDAEFRVLVEAGLVVKGE